MAIVLTERSPSELADLIEAARPAAGLRMKATGRKPCLNSMPRSQQQSHLAFYRHFGITFGLTNNKAAQSEAFDRVT